MMTATRFFNCKTFGVVIMFCVLCSSVVLATETKSTHESESVNPNNSFQQQLLERSQKYLDSIRQRSADLSPEVQAKLKLHAQDTVNKGLANLNCPAKLVQKRTVSANMMILSNAIRKIDQRIVFKVTEFLSHEFCCVTEWDVAVRVALPFWNYWRNSRFTVNNSTTLWSLFGSDDSNYTAVVVSVFHKTLADIFGQPIVASDIAMNSVFHRIKNDDFLSGFTPIAQTIIQRK
jgi:hypothetical protein